MFDRCVGRVSFGGDGSIGVGVFSNASTIIWPTFIYFNF